MFIETSSKAGYNVKQVRPYWSGRVLISFFDLALPPDCQCSARCWQWQAKWCEASCRYWSNQAATNCHRRGLLLVLNYSPLIPVSAALNYFDVRNCYIKQTLNLLFHPNILESKQSTKWLVNPSQFLVELACYCRSFWGSWCCAISSILHALCSSLTHCCQIWLGSFLVVYTAIKHILAFIYSLATFYTSHCNCCWYVVVYHLHRFQVKCNLDKRTWSEYIFHTIKQSVYVRGQRLERNRVVNERTPGSNEKDDYEWIEEEKEEVH